MNRARISQFYKRSVAERLSVLRERGVLTQSDYTMLSQSSQLMCVAGADKMVENVVGVFGLPLGLGLNFVVNQRPYVVPMVVEEASIIAGLSFAAKLVADSGGFTVESEEPLLIGQVQVVGVPHPSRAQQAILQHRDDIINLANSLHPKMVARGGGVRDVEVRLHPSSQGQDMLVVHLLVDTRDAMGANLVNTMCEGVAALVEKLTGGRVFLRILSNLTDRAMVCARVNIPVDRLHGKGFTGESVRDGIVLANEFATIDPYRAATHNKGVMNGIDAVALATGNDWRAIEAAAHAYAGRGTAYTALTQWSQGPDGALVGQLEMPLKVGTVGGNLSSNPAVGLAHRILGITGARELAEVMVAVGLAQNFAALRALVTDGIQQGHMTLHARSVVASAQTPEHLFDQVLERLVESGEIKVWKAREIAASLQVAPPATTHVDPEEDTSPAVGHGKIVLLGEHAVVHGGHALAAPIPLAIRARVEDALREGVHLMIPAWGVEGHLKKQDDQNSLHASLHTILSKLGLRQRNMVIKVTPKVPRAMGLGGSAALAVAVIRALSLHYKLSLSDSDVNALAYQSELVAHGTPSGVDNTMATYGRLLLFKKGDPPQLQPIAVQAPIPVVIGMSGIESLTAKMVAQVHRAWSNNQKLYDRIFEDIDQLTLEAATALQANDLPLLGELMNINQGLLNALQVSSWELEELIEIARKHGAIGAKLTGSGGGGSMIALCPEHAQRVADAMVQAGYRAFVTTLG